MPEMHGKNVEEMCNCLKGVFLTVIDDNVPWKENNGRGRLMWMTFRWWWLYRKTSHFGKRLKERQSQQQNIRRLTKRQKI
jgi:hypothetical protein